MHRSGTSALAGALEGLGLNIGKTLMLPDAEGNPKGHFENRGVADLHGRFLTDVGRDWMDPQPLRLDLLAGKAAQRFRKHLPLLLVREFGHERPLIKDPRLCILLPLWMPLIEGAFRGACFLLPIRHPLEVAFSLRKRNGFSLSHGLALWTIHVLEAERATRSLRRQFSTYNQLLDSPAETLHALARSLGLPAHNVPAVVEHRLDPDLRHHSEPPWPATEPHADLILAIHEALTRRAPGMENTLDSLREAYYRQMEW